jgi:hypothetical protein
VSHFEQLPTPAQPGQPGQPAQPGQPTAFGAVFAPAAVEILSSEGGSVQPPPRRRRTGLIAGIATVVVLALGAGGLAAWSAFNGGGAQPESVLPATTVAFAKVDLDPSAGQKVELFKLLQKFPENAQLAGTDKDFGQWLVRRLVESGSGTSGIDFGRDIQPWLGKRFAVAGVPGPSAKEPIDGVVVLQETDQKAATAALEKIKHAKGAAKLGYAFANGYVVISPDSSTAAQAAVKAAQAASLGDAATYKADVASLASDQVVTAWANAGAVGRLIKQQMGTASGLPAASVGPLIDATYKGRWVLGLHVVSGIVEMQVDTLGGTPSPATPPIAHLNDVAADSWAVVASSGVDQRVDSMWKQLSAIPTYQSSVRQVEDQLGLSLPGDLKTLLGSELEVSLAGNLSSQPAFVVAATSPNPTAAKELLDRLLRRAGAPAGTVAERIGQPYTLYVGNTQAGVDTAGDNSFAANVLFDQSVADPATAEVVGFVDMSHVWSSFGADFTTQQQKEWEHVAAIGFSGRHSGGAASYTLRIVLK